MTQVLRTLEEVKSALSSLRATGEKIGFVPTMGALHEGHASLLKKSVQENSHTVLSIFVNPTQFGPNEDLAKYPRTFESDLELAKKSGVGFVFAPTSEVIYPEGWSTFIEVQGLTDVLCGKFRPGHFRGVATVVYRLLKIVEPTVAYFGQKDLQQCLVIQKMVSDLDLPVTIEIGPTVREADGLAMSSRNRYLSPEERKKAIGIFRALQTVKSWKQKGEKHPDKLVHAAKETLARVPEFQIQYAEIRDLENLRELSELDRPAAFFVAGFLGNTRLIDNIIF
ncbi:MAG: pantoate--beta-alanine ligase [Bacteriovoracia bacterium]